MMNTPLLTATAGLRATFAGVPRRNAVWCCDAVDLLMALPTGCIDLIITSPPYDNLRTYNGYSFDFEAIARESYRVLKTGGVLVWVVGDATINGSEAFTSFRQALYFKDVVGFNGHDTMIWDKNSLTFPDTNRYYQVFEYMFVLSKGFPKTTNLLTQPNKWAGHSADKRKRLNGNDLEFNPHATGRVVKDMGIMTNLWRVNTGYSKATLDTFAFLHPAIFPELLAERHILTWSNPGDLVLDYFAGSGTSLKMARNTGRDYIGGDISHDYVQICRERLRASLDEPHYVTRESAPMEDLPLFSRAIGE